MYRSTRQLDYPIQSNFYLYPVTFESDPIQPVEIRLYYVRIMDSTI